MNRKTFIAAALVAVVFIFLPSTPVAKPPISVPDLVQASFQSADELINDKNFSEAYKVYDKLIQHADLPPEVLAMVWDRMGRAQKKNGQTGQAIASLKRAVMLDPTNEDYKVYLADLRGIRYKPIDRDQPSRFYGSWQNAGSAKQLLHTSGVLHVFVQGRNSRHWTQRERLIAKAQVEESSEWLRLKSGSYKIHPKPTFQHKYLILTDEIYWSKLNVPDWKSNNREINDWSNGIPSRFGATSFDDLFSKAFPGVQFDNKAIVFHAIKEGRAFALPNYCSASWGIGWETAFVHVADDLISTPSHAVTYTHELLHLYGADDLYNKVPDPIIPRDDIMNCKTWDLEHTVIGSLTAYAIGWTNRKPHLTNLQMEKLTRP